MDGVWIGWGVIDRLSLVVVLQSLSRFRDQMGRVGYLCSHDLAILGA